MESMYDPGHVVPEMLDHLLESLKTLTLEALVALVTGLSPDFDITQKLPELGEFLIWRLIKGKEEHIPSLAQILVDAVTASVHIEEELVLLGAENHVHVCVKKGLVIDEPDMKWLDETGDTTRKIWDCCGVSKSKGRLDA